MHAPRAIGVLACSIWFGTVGLVSFFPPRPVGFAPRLGFAYFVLTEVEVGNNGECTCSPSLALWNSIERYTECSYGVIKNQQHYPELSWNAFLLLLMTKLVLRCGVI